MTTMIDPQTELLERLRQEFVDMRRDFEARLKALETAIGQNPDASTTSQPELEAEAEEPIAEETIAIIAAAVTSFLGKKVRVRSARRVYSGESTWAQQGRVFVQASHNLSR